MLAGERPIEEHTLDGLDAVDLCRQGFDHVRGDGRGFFLPPGAVATAEPTRKRSR